MLLGLTEWTSFKWSDQGLSTILSPKTSESIMVIPPYWRTDVSIEDDLIEEAMDCMSKVVSAHESNGSNFSFIIGKDAVSKVSFFNIWAKSFSINVIPIAITKGKYIINLHRSIDKLKVDILDAKIFWIAEKYHQDFAVKNPIKFSQ